MLRCSKKHLTLAGTGVAWANVNLQTDKIYWIQKWPGRKQAAENKVGREDKGSVHLFIDQTPSGSNNSCISHKFYGAVFMGFLGRYTDGAISGESRVQRMVQDTFGRGGITATTRNYEGQNLTP